MYGDFSLADTTKIFTACILTTIIMMEKVKITHHFLNMVPVCFVKFYNSVLSVL